MKLSNYSGEKLDTICKINLNCEIGNKIEKIRFEVYNGNAAPILGLPTIEKFNLLQRNNQKETNNVCELNINDKFNFVKEFKDVFGGYGKIKDFEYKIELKKIM